MYFLSLPFFVYAKRDAEGEDMAGINEEFPMIKISVRNLVEFILRSGDIDNRVGALAKADAMQQGSRIHRKIQRKMVTSNCSRG